MASYVALLRGINVGGNKMVKMDDLKKHFESLGFEKVKTVLATGNVCFETAKTAPAKLQEKIQEKLEKELWPGITVMVRSSDEIQELIDLDPFKGIKITPLTRLYVTFLSESSKSALKIPYESPEKDFKILRVSDGEVCSVLTLSPTRKSTEAMNILEKAFGKKVTTRNWNTVRKIAKA